MKYREVVALLNIIHTIKHILILIQLLTYRLSGCFVFSSVVC